MSAADGHADAEGRLPSKSDGQQSLRQGSKTATSELSSRPSGASAGERVLASASPSHRGAPLTGLNRSKSTPAPGQYMWNDQLRFKKRPQWSMSSPDRAHKDMILPTWTPASPSLQPRAPDPGEYGDISSLGKNGKFSSAKYSFGGAGHRPCLAPNPPQRIELELQVRNTVGGHHPAKKMGRSWSVYGKDRSQLPGDLTTWTPRPTFDIRPGPGQHNLTTNWHHSSSRWNVTTKRGSTWGGRPKDLPDGLMGWTPQTRGSRPCHGEWSRHPATHKNGERQLA